ncbi:hypothetical protein [Helicobacter mehlei]|uniref:Helix-turn-helix domain-containing protein n=1 Tax=Helicobacter mehlei TaxID=2316080 RepID=A0A553UJH7_9HELI|nr:hypothetical protein [Helicobacter mehlei]TSA80342.1 hypothetical protein FNE76_07435 [Helicobacter mehlei]
MRFKCGLCAQEIAILAYINHLPAEWSLSTAELGKALGLGLNTTLKYLRHLKAKGLLEVHFLRAQRGRLNGLTQWVLHMPTAQQLQPAKNDYPPKNGGMPQKSKSKPKARKAGNATDCQKMAASADKGTPTIRQNLNPFLINYFKKHEKPKRACTHAHGKQRQSVVFKGLKHTKGVKGKDLYFEWKNYKEGLKKQESELISSTTQ